MSSLFHREVSLEIAPAGGGAGKSYSGLRVKFKVDMSDDSSPNEATITAYNINADSRALASEEGAIIRLLVGYRGGSQAIFEGNTIEGGVKYARSGPDSTLTLKCQDGGDALVSEISVSYDADAEVTAEDAFKKIADAAGLSVGSINMNTDVRWTNGLVLSGAPRDMLRRLSTTVDARVFVRDGSLYVVPYGESTGEGSLLFSVAQGNLIGYPELGDDGIVKVKALIAPSMRPGHLFQVESLEASGNYTATSVSFTGDSGYANDFYVLISGEPLDG